jgi:alcohol dehydrogenase class IV
VDVAERVMAKLVAHDADCLISLGGGSTIGLGKALALRTDLPQIVLPTTYAGSEATPALIGSSKAMNFSRAMLFLGLSRHLLFVPS